MLIDFAVENFKSFDSLVRLNMVATRETEHPNHCLALNLGQRKVRVNKFAALFGPNAGGKSNLLNALQAMQKMVFECGIRQVGSEEKIKPLLPHEPFRLNKQNRQAPTLFQVIYEYEGQCFRYGFTYTAEEILNEWLYAGFEKEEELVFERDGLTVNEGTQGKGFKTEAQKFLNCSSLVLSICSQAKHELAQEASAFFVEMSFGEEFNSTNLAHFLFSSPFLPVVAGMMQFADIGVTDIKLREVKTKASVEVSNRNSKFHDEIVSGDFVKTLKLLIDELSRQQPTQKVLLFCHSTRNGELENEECQLRTKDESRGTLRFALLLNILCQAMIKNGLVILDEIETGLHPLLVRGVIDFVTRVRGVSTQVLFTTHCTPLFDNSALRRDELWLVEKDDGGCSSLHCAADYKQDARPDANLMRRFMEGRFGGLPLLRGSILESGSDLTSKILTEIRTSVMPAQRLEKKVAGRGLSRKKPVTKLSRAKDKYSGN
ncbi:AAA family ATPase [Desulfovibrio falkowii]|uniref:AAA family ATPase n=1 Tax=Desulfovibrio sp. WGS1351 TaxID=3366814 RepID=UPI00372D1CB7